jgi:hypothetical protein
MLLLYAPPEPENCCHLLPVACCSAIATPEPEVCGNVLLSAATAVLAPPELAPLASPELTPCFLPAAVTAVGNLPISQLCWSAVPRSMVHGPANLTCLGCWSAQHAQETSSSSKCDACACTSFVPELRLLCVASPYISGLMGHLKFLMSALLVLPNPVPL